METNAYTAAAAANAVPVTGDPFNSLLHQAAVSIWNASETLSLIFFNRYRIRRPEKKCLNCLPQKGLNGLPQEKV